MANHHKLGLNPLLHLFESNAKVVRHLPHLVRLLHPAILRKYQHPDAAVVACFVRWFLFSVNLRQHIFSLVTAYVLKIVANVGCRRPRAAQVLFQ